MTCLRSSLNIFTLRYDPSGIVLSPAYVLRSTILFLFKNSDADSFGRAVSYGFLADAVELPKDYPGRFLSFLYWLKKALADFLFLFLG